MSTANLITDIFSTNTLTKRNDKTVALPLCDRSFEGDFKQGDRVHIPGVGTPTSHDLGKDGKFSTEPEDIEDEGAEFVIDQRKYVVFHTNDVSALQENQSAVNRFTDNYANEMVKEQDSYIYSLIKSDRGVIPCDVTSTVMTPVNAYGLVSKALSMLYHRHSSLTPGDISIEVDPYIAILLAEALQYHGTPNDLKNGNTGLVINGVSVYQSNNTVVTDAAGTVLADSPDPTSADFLTSKFHGVVRTKRSIVFAEPKSMSWQSGDMGKDGVGQYIKGWYYYGGKTLYPDEVVDFIVTPGANTVI